MTETRNKRKVVGAYVWHQNEIKRITLLLDKPNVMLNNLHKVSTDTVKLVKIGDEMKFKSLEHLPDSSKKKIKIRVTGFLDNDLINISKTKSKPDRYNYQHFAK